MLWYVEINARCMEQRNMHSVMQEKCRCVIILRSTAWDRTAQYKQYTKYLGDVSGQVSGRQWLCFIIVPYIIWCRSSWSHGIFHWGGFCKCSTSLCGVLGAGVWGIVRGVGGYRGHRYLQCAQPRQQVPIPKQMIESRDYTMIIHNLRHGLNRCPVDISLCYCWCRCMRASGKCTCYLCAVLGLRET